MIEELHDIIVNIDIILSVPSTSQEEAYEKVESFTTEEMLSLALKQVPFHSTMVDDKSMVVLGKATIN